MTTSKIDPFKYTIDSEWVIHGIKSPEDKRLNGQMCSVVKVTKSHIEVTISGRGLGFVRSFGLEKDGTTKKFIVKPDNLSPNKTTSFSGFNFGKDCQETKTISVSGFDFGKDCHETKTTSFSGFDFGKDCQETKKNNVFNSLTKTTKSFSFVDNLKHPSTSKFSLVATQPNNEYLFYKPLGENPFEFGPRDKEIAALRKISLFVSKKKNKRKKRKKQRADAVTKIKNGLKSHVHAFIMKRRVAIKITAAVISTKSRQLRCRSMARKIQKCVRTVYNRHMASKMIQKVSEP